MRSYTFRREREEGVWMRVIAGAVVWVLASGVAVGQNLPLPPLPYAYDALVPVIDEETMRTHHLKHHQGYTDKLNAALQTLRGDSSTKHLAKMGVDKLLTNLDDVPASLRGAVRNNGGGYVNHVFFWASMQAPKEDNAPAVGSTIAIQLDKAFGSVDGFKEIFSQTSLGVFGSGWAWLVFDVAHGVLKITHTANQDVPKDPPILGIDVWEHAYYLKYKNRRAEYVNKWFDVVNWETANERLEKLVQAGDAAKEL